MPCFASLEGTFGTTVLFSTHIVSDLGRVASHVVCLHGHQLVLAAYMDDLKETHGLLRLTAETATGVYGKVPGLEDLIIELTS
jgi:ABC-2 type transport system ATP-binding protein